jgi:hypothetical protein
MGDERADLESRDYGRGDPAALTKIHLSISKSWH